MRPSSSRRPASLWPRRPRPPSRCSPAAHSAGPQIGQPAPAFSLTTIDGKTVTLDSYRGKTLVLNIWATWCPPCRGETSDLLTRLCRLHKEGVEFLGVDDTEQAPIVRAFVADKGVPYPQAIDATQTFSKAYDIRYFPTTFVIDPQGIVRARHIDQVTPTLLASFVASAKAGQNVAFTSPQQVKIDALFANPDVTFTGDAAAVEKDAIKVNAIIDKAEGYVDDADASKGLGRRLPEHTRGRSGVAGSRDRRARAGRDDEVARSAARADARRRGARSRGLGRGAQPVRGCASHRSQRSGRTSAA